MNVTGCRFIVHHTENYQISSTIMGRVADFVLVDPQDDEAGHVGECIMFAVVVADQDECAELLQTAQKS